MRGGLRIDGAAWVVLAGLLCMGSIVVTAISVDGATPLDAAPLAQALDWPPPLGLHEPWWVYVSIPFAARD